MVEGDESVTAALLPDPAYTILSPSNAVLTIADAGTNQTSPVAITNPVGGVVYLVGTNVGLVLNATVSGDDPSNTLTWSEVSGPDSYSFSSTNTADTTIMFTGPGIYVLRLTVDNGQLQSHADITAIVAADLLTGSNLLHWPFDEGSGTNVTDISGAGRDGILAGGPVWVTNGVLGGALSFSGTNDFVRQTGGTNFLDGLQAFTLSLWLKPATTNFDEGFFAANDSGTNETLELTTRTYASCGNNTNVIELNLPTTGHGASRQRQRRDPAVPVAARGGDMEQRPRTGSLHQRPAGSANVGVGRGVRHADELSAIPRRQGFDGQPRSMERGD